MSQAAWAQELARSLLAEPLPRRWRHTQGVAGQAERLADIAGPDADLLGAAAWLHDVGYSPDLVDSGQHALDGARYLRSRQVDDRICRLVAHHSCALIEARERGLEAELSAEFAPEEEGLADALTYCDMTTDPEGRLVTFDERLAEIQGRYGPGHLVSRSMTAAAPMIREAIAKVELLRSRPR